MDENNLKFQIIGKDKRLFFCYELMKNSGYNARFCSDDVYITADADCYVFGIPAKRNVFPADLSALKRNSAIFAGMIAPDVEELLKNRGFRVFDYAKSEFFLNENAALTAEAAMTVYTGACGRGFKGCEILITGFGRIGKALARMLVAHGANVTVSARKYEDIMNIPEYGCYPMETVAINGSFDVIFNTVPANIFTRDVLDRTETKTYVELASPPYGIENNSFWTEKTQVILASGLPGKVLPVSAGSIIKEAVCTTLKEIGI